MSDSGIDELAVAIRRAERILVFTGAGISTASGIPDFRGPKGVWKMMTPVFYQDFMASDDERHRYWLQKADARAAFGDAAPNAVHHAIVDLERAGKVVMVVTQNVDGLHAAAGTSRDLLVEVHGTEAEIECQSCGDRSAPEPHYALFRETRVPPLCDCGGYLKSGTISFGQNLRHGDLERAHDAAAESDLVLALGSTLSVVPAAYVPLAAADRGAAYVIVNRGPTDHDQHSAVSLRIEGDVTDVVPTAIALADRAHDA